MSLFTILTTFKDFDSQASKATFATLQLKQKTLDLFLGLLPL